MGKGSVDLHKKTTEEVEIDLPTPPLEEEKKAGFERPVQKETSKPVTLPEAAKKPLSLPQQTAAKKPVAQPEPAKKLEVKAKSPETVKIPKQTPKPAQPQPRFMPLQAMKPLKTPSPAPVVKPVAKKPEPPKRMMYQDLKFRDWPTTKNIKVKLVTIVSENLIYLCEDNADVEAYLGYINEEISSHCKDQKRSSPYAPM